ncbi:hypothetical protein BJX99DRAFT_235891 [Aspergillus californicus]
MEIERRVPSRLFRVKRSAFYDFPLLGATATASTVSYNIDFPQFRYPQGGVRFLCIWLCLQRISLLFLFEIMPPSPTHVSGYYPISSESFWRIEGLTGKKSTSTGPGPCLSPVSFSFLSFHSPFTRRLRAFLGAYWFPCTFMSLKLVHEDHDAWVIEGWDSLHCIWRWLATGSTKSAQVFCGG